MLIIKKFVISCNVCSLYIYVREITRKKKLSIVSTVMTNIVDLSKRIIASFCNLIHGFIVVLTERVKTACVYSFDKIKIKKNGFGYYLFLLSYYREKKLFAFRWKNKTECLRFNLFNCLLFRCMIVLLS